MERVNEHDLPFRNGNYGAKYLFRGPLHEWGVIVLEAGTSMSPHKHEKVEETFYFEQGTPQFVVDGVSHRVKPGDVFKLDAGEGHEIINDGEQDARLIFIKCPFIPDDKVDLA
jgi:mannose-6-phosphate isomerase-like protein (cupin superfamily)